ncbi:putative cycloartenol synthase [Rosa chinensis]|uniref:Putative cycloartenol synthase n=1 Tax=Rosa chinensis TaxID=74649 RepID=A0A2P6RE88_ROSCH|nr:putative cycloartenol synthase [Rosa chinensis]
MLNVSDQNSLLHPSPSQGRMWYHCRMVYLLVSYFYGKQFVGPVTPNSFVFEKGAF